MITEKLDKGVFGGATAVALDAEYVDLLAHNMSTFASSGILVFNNNGTVEVWYDAAMSTNNGESDVTLIGTITTAGAVADLANLNAAHFA